MALSHARLMSKTTIGVVNPQTASVKDGIHVASRVVGTPINLRFKIFPANRMKNPTINRASNALQIEIDRRKITKMIRKINNPHPWHLKSQTT